jgi:hypothetical protein
VDICNLRTLFEMLELISVLVSAGLWFCSVLPGLGEPHLWTMSLDDPQLQSVAADIHDERRTTQRPRNPVPPKTVTMRSFMAAEAQIRQLTPELTSIARFTSRQWHAYLPLSMT